MPQRVVVVEDQAMFLQLLVGMLRAQRGIEVVAVARGVQEAIAACDQQSPDVVILDLQLADGWGLEVAEHLAATHPAGRVIVLSSHASSFQRPLALRHTIAAVLDKSRAYEDLIAALGRLRQGGGEPAPLAAELQDRLQLLTDRERAVLALLGRGLSSQQLALSLGMSVHTADTHRRRIGEKLGLRGAALIHQATLWVQLLPPLPGADPGAGSDPL